ncbi:MAG: alpha/beta hydrolase [Firmicutes bacterium]|nr:alpha/beta hydrolase [Bacillota bacterium]
MQPVNEGYIQSGRYNFFYRNIGQTGPAVVFIHGIPTHSFLWQQVMSFLGDNYTTIAPDLLGYGQSSRGSVEDLTLHSQAQHILSILDQLGIEKAHFVGHDLGGGIVQILAVNNPDRVLSITVADGVCFSNWPLPTVVSMRWPTAPEFEPSPFIVQQMLREGMHNQKMLTADIINAFTLPFKDYEDYKALQLAASALEHHETEALVPHLPNINVPTTILWGQYDRFLPPYWGLRLQQAIPNSRLHILPNCGHYSMLDDPQLFSHELGNHLQQNSVMPGIAYKEIRATPSLTQYSFL